MKKFIFFVVAVVVAVWADDATEQKRTEEFENLQENLNTCQQNLGLLPSDIQTKGYAHVKEEDKDYIGAIMLCVYTKVGVMSENGDLIEARVQSLYTNLRGDSHRTKETIQKILKECKPNDNDSPKRKAFSYEACLDRLN
ncbi:unnamed protein product [Diabrotica balteata]|uniref:Uncharacterized protein n=1 Tax=Diabrotica balteata TaxID=107213 RepID=A0A9N9TA70_DIABA|nr:unnamed protein product [Diabrotica balteata]